MPFRGEFWSVKIYQTKGFFSIFVLMFLLLGPCKNQSKNIEMKSAIGLCTIVLI